MPLFGDILNQYSELLSEADRWFAKCSLAAGNEVACRRGCSACCRGLFDITILDACLLNKGIQRLPEPDRNKVLIASKSRLSFIQRTWPDFTYPYLLNSYPEEEYGIAMPEDDEIPCPLLGEDLSCLVYENRPMTCRLHGIPMVNSDGELFSDEWCTKNFRFTNPLEMKDLQFDFRGLFAQEQLLFREFTLRLFNKHINELDTIIPAASLINFTNIRLPENLWNRKHF